MQVKLKTLPKFIQKMSNKFYLIILSIMCIETMCIKCVANEFHKEMFLLQLPHILLRICIPNFSTVLWKSMTTQQFKASAFEYLLELENLQSNTYY